MFGNLRQVRKSRQQRKHSNRRRLKMEQMEQRLLFSASPIDTTVIVDEDGDFFQVDIESGNATYAGTPAGVKIVELAQDGNGQLFGLGKSVFTHGQNLYQIDLGSFIPELTLVGAPGVKMNALEFRQDGRLFGASGNNLYEINPLDGTSEFVLELAGHSTGDLTFDASRNLYMTSGWNHLIKVNAGLTSSVDLGQIGPNGMNLEGLVAQADGYLYGFDYGGQWMAKIDPDAPATVSTSILENSQGLLDGIRGATGSIECGCSPVESNVIMVGKNLKVYEVNVVNGNTTEVGSTPVVMSDIAADSDGRLFAYGGELSSSGQLYRADTTGGDWTLIGQPGVSISALEFGPEGLLYGVYGNRVYTVDPNTGTQTPVSVIPIPTVVEAGDLAFDSQGHLYITLTGQTGWLARYEPGISNPVLMQTHLLEVTGLTTHEDGYLRGFSHYDQRLYRIDPDSGEAVGAVPLGDNQPQWSGVLGATQIVTNDGPTDHRDRYIVDDFGNLFKSDPIDGGLSVSFVGTMAARMRDIAQDADGRMYGVDGKMQLWQIDPDDATSELIGQVDIPIVTAVGVIEALEFRADGLLFGVIGTQIIQIDTNNADATVELNMGSYGSHVGHYSDLTFDQASNMYLTTQSGKVIRANASLTSAVVIGEGMPRYTGLMASEDNFIYAFTDDQQVHRFDLDVTDPVALGYLTSSGNTLGKVWGATGPITFDCCNSTPNQSDTYVNDLNGDLFKVDFITGQTTYMGTTDSVMYDIALDPFGQLWGMGDAGTQLYRIASDGAITPVGDPVLGHVINALEFDRAGRLIGGSNERFYEINTEDGTQTFITLINAGLTSAGDITFDEDNNLYMTNSTFDGVVIKVAPDFESYEWIGGPHGPYDLDGLVYGEDGFLYGTRRVSQEVYRIDIVTGEVELAENDVFNGILSHPLMDGVYGAAGLVSRSTPDLSDSHVSDSNGYLFTINSETGQTVHVGSMGTTMLDIARDGTGQLWGVGGGKLHRIGDDGSTTPVGSLGTFVNALEFREDGHLIGAGSNRLYEIDTNTGISTTLMTLPESSAGDLTFDHANKLYLTSSSGKLVRANATLDHADVVSDPGISGLYGVTYAGDGFLHGIRSNRQVFRINIATGSSTYEGTLSHPLLNTVYGATGSIHLCACDCEDKSDLFTGLHSDVISMFSTKSDETESTPVDADLKDAAMMDASLSKTADSGSGDSDYLDDPVDLAFSWTDTEKETDTQTIDSLFGDLATDSKLTLALA